MNMIPQFNHFFFFALNLKSLLGRNMPSAGSGGILLPILNPVATGQTSFYTMQHTWRQRSLSQKSETQSAFFMQRLASVCRLCLRGRGFGRGEERDVFKGGGEMPGTWRMSGLLGNESLEPPSKPAAQPQQPSLLLAPEQGGLQESGPRWKSWVGSPHRSAPQRGQVLATKTWALW